jgi:hypothetical protein
VGEGHGRILPTRSREPGAGFDLRTGVMRRSRLNADRNP